MIEMYTTLNKLRDRSPCSAGWHKLLKHLGKTTADDAPLSIAAIEEANGKKDAIWALRAFDNYDQEKRLYYEQFLSECDVWCRWVPRSH